MMLHGSREKGFSSRRVVRNVTSTAKRIVPQSAPAAVRCAFGVLTLVFVGTNELVVVLWPFCFTHTEDSASGKVEISRVGTNPPNLAWLPANPSDGVAPPLGRFATSWTDLQSPLRRLPPSVMRLLPDRIGEADARRSPCWLAFGMSSVKRVGVDYLAVTLSHLFNELRSQTTTKLRTAIVLHLADFDEPWVNRTSVSLGAVFADEIEERRFHVIHAPRQLYPERRLELESIVLGYFSRTDLNGHYSNNPNITVGGRETYWYRRYFVYWCTTKGRWALAPSSAFDSVTLGSSCPWTALSPEHFEFLHVLPRGWEEQGLTVVPAASHESPGVVSVQHRKEKFLKFGDSDKRQWWRSKQNLDYAFLMWYAAGLSEYYMQLEDDVQVVPDFFQSVHRDMLVRMMGEQWSMVSFSKLGFIGKLFNSTWLPSLADFLLAFFDELPCDWLVWIWVDALSPSPETDKVVTGLMRILDDVDKRLAAGTEPAKLPVPREDLALFFRTNQTPLFSEAYPAPEEVKPIRSENGQRYPRPPAATLTSTFHPYINSKLDSAYSLIETDGFWTSDVCWSNCDAKTKYIEIAFHQPVAVKSIEVLTGGGPENSNDFIRHGSLQISRGASLLRNEENTTYSGSITGNLTCGAFVTVASIHSTVTHWTSPSRSNVHCVRIALMDKQQAWILFRKIAVIPFPTEVSSSSPAKVDVSRQADKDEPLMQAGVAVLAGLFAGVAGWASLQLGQIRVSTHVSTVGDFTWWTVSFVLALDVFLLALVVPPVPPAIPSPVSLGSNQRGGSSRRGIAVSVSSLLTRASLPVDKPTIRSGPGGDDGGGTSLQAPEGLNWAGLIHGIHSLPVHELLVLGNPSPGLHESRHWLTIGMIVDVSKPWDRFVGTIRETIRAGTQAVTVAVLLTDGDRWLNGGPSRAAEQREHLLQSAKKELDGEIRQGLLRIFHAPNPFYPGLPARDSNVDLAMLLSVAAPLADYFLQLEPSCTILPAFVKVVKKYVDDTLREKRWLVTFFRQNGFLRHMMRPRVMRRMAELLLLVPDVPADMLFFDAIDIVNNETSPESLQIATKASKTRRPDVIQHYLDRPALIEHLGDVSSLHGKVQRLSEDYFTKHDLQSTLFDNPPPEAVIRTNLSVDPDRIRSLYGLQSAKNVRCGSHSAPTCALCPQGHGAAWCNLDCMWDRNRCQNNLTIMIPPQGAFIEIRFTKPHDIEIVLLSMGGPLRRSNAAMKNNVQKINVDVENDFDWVLDNAELLFGRGLAVSSSASGTYPSCSSYYSVERAVGREVFWKTPASRPAMDISCIAISIPHKQLKPLVLRDVKIRRGTCVGKGVQRVCGEGSRQRLSLDVHELDDRTTTIRQALLDRWDEQHFAWVLTVRVAFMSGCVAGIFCYVRKLLSKQHRRRR
eukprot:TRINITY_DN13476_c0_g3_i1.p1 TRINITY_DN13476_c0_g3~~TRINITY_DN13476_c0_g3_i1.p1  ORF type:complete len:1399 (+),score=171.05 TRINITY_DN13476_c0_g3_i1:127-4323(+)